MSKFKNYITSSWSNQVLMHSPTPSWSSLSSTILFRGLSGIILVMLPEKTGTHYAFWPFFKMGTTKSDFQDIRNLRFHGSHFKEWLKWLMSHICFLVISLLWFLRVSWTIWYHSWRIMLDHGLNLFLCSNSLTHVICRFDRHRYIYGYHIWFNKLLWIMKVHGSFKT